MVSATSLVHMGRKNRQGSEDVVEPRPDEGPGNTHQCSLLIRSGGFEK